jgi:hypothetical protein
MVVYQKSKTLLGSKENAFIQAVRLLNCFLHSKMHAGEFICRKQVDFERTKTWMDLIFKTRG